MIDWPSLSKKFLHEIRSLLLLILFSGTKAADAEFNQVLVFKQDAQTFINKE